MVWITDKCRIFGRSSNYSSAETFAESLPGPCDFSKVRRCGWVYGSRPATWREIVRTYGSEIPCGDQPLGVQWECRQGTVSNGTEIVDASLQLQLESGKRTFVTPPVPNIKVDHYTKLTDGSICIPMHANTCHHGACLPSDRQRLPVPTTIPTTSTIPSERSQPFERRLEAHSQRLEVMESAFSAMRNKYKDMLRS